jgi:predicted amidohydrolase
MTLRFAAIQMSSQDDQAANLARAKELCAEAKAQGAAVALLPENFAFMGTEEDKRAIAEETAGQGPILSFLREAARANGLWLIAGGLPERSIDPERPFNASVVVSPAGEIAATYRKIHLFDVDVGDGATYRESASTSRGAEPVAIDIAGFKVGLSVCYDLRFPELYRALARLGADILTVPAAFTLQTGKDHWHVLLRARAIESQAYVVAAAQWGGHPRGRRTYGKSCVIDPWGDVIAQASEGEGVVVATIDRERIARVRAQLPSLEHRRLP